MGQTVSVVTVGCGRNVVDSDELAARLTQAGWQLSPDGAVVVVNTCGFIESARTQSVDVLLDAAATGATVVAVGCMAERYGKDLAAALPEAAAVLSFDDYPDIAARLTDVLAGSPPPAHTPRDRRRLLPITPVERAGTGVPGHGRRRHRLDSGPVAPLKLASGCDRRCTFCAIPRFRGAFVSRPPDEIVAEAEWLAGQGVREVLLVSENTTSYGKDLGDLQALEKLLPRLAAVVDRVRVSYLQPAELRPGLIETIAATSGVVPYFEVSFQHASGPVLRRMRRFGDREQFLTLLDTIREHTPAAGFRSNFIAGFPGETEADFAELREFVSVARLDAIGVFGYSDEEGTAAADLPDKIDPKLVARRVDELSLLADQMCAQRAAERMGSDVQVLIGETGTGWAEHQGPADGRVTVKGETVRAGDLLRVRVIGTHGVDLVAEPA